MKVSTKLLKTLAISLLILLAGSIQLSATVSFFNRLAQFLKPAAATLSTALPASHSASAKAIQVALLLDTSNSMDGLIEQAKSQLWKILGELSRARKDGEIPELQIALYEYGNDGLDARTGHIRQVAPFTSDMDLISEKLFALTTNGGSEYCGQVIHSSLNNLDWSENEGALRLIYIAGNEPFNQGSISYSEACALARQKDVVVNTIFCGHYDSGISSYWKDGATLGKGSYSSIDHNAATTYIETPYDLQITQLNLDLNSTYLAYGQDGASYQEKQLAQDANAGKYSQANVAERAAFKSSKNYTNEHWDLIDAYQKDEQVIKKKKQLPESLREMEEAEIKAVIEQKIKARQSINQEIRELNEKRRAFIEAEKARRGEEKTNTLESSVLVALKAQLLKKGFVID